MSITWPWQRSIARDVEMLELTNKGFIGILDRCDRNEADIRSVAETVNINARTLRTVLDRIEFLEQMIVGPKS